MKIDVDSPSINFCLVAGYIFAFFSFGRWIFFDFFDLKFAIQVASLFLTTIALLCIFLSSNPRFSWRELVITVCFLVAMLGDGMRGEVAGAIELLICAYLVFGLCMVDNLHIIRISRGLVITSSMFAFFSVIMTIIASVGLVAASDIYVSYAALNETYLSPSPPSPLIVFGMVIPFSSFDYLGFEIFRLLGFTSEPARLTIYYVIPMVLALILGRAWMACFWILMSACLLTNSLSVLGPILFCAMALILNGYLRWPASTWIRGAYVVCALSYLAFWYLGEGISESLIDLRMEAQDTDYSDVVRGSAPVKFASMMLLMYDTLLYFPMPIPTQVVNGPLLFYVIALGSITCLPLVFVLPIQLSAASSLLSGSLRYRSAWFLILGIWGLAMTFTTSPFFFTAAGVIGITLLVRLLRATREAGCAV